MFYMKAGNPTRQSDIPVQWEKRVLYIKGIRNNKEYASSKLPLKNELYDGNWDQDCHR